ncbi:MAG: helix-turn-helix domain-containing protein [Acidimicrobiales bacterium]
MTPAQILYQRRVAVLEHAQRTKNVSATCRVFGISRTRYYEWKNRADAYGLDALMPKERRAPQMPEATPTHVIEALLTLAVLRPTLGCRRYADLLGDQGYAIAKSTVQKHLVTHGLGTRSQRLARAAAITAMTTGLVTEAARDDGVFGFCLATGGPGELVCLDSFYIGNLKGVGKVYQLTAIDVFTRWAFVMIVLGPVTGTHTARFVDRLLAHYRRHGIRVRAVLTDGGPEYRANAFCAHLVAKGLRHHHPGSLAQPQRGVRALPGHRPAGVLAPGLPPPALHLDPPAPGRGRCVAGRLPPPMTEPRRLHARPDPASDARQAPEEQGSMTINHRDHLSPRPSVWKP